MYFCEECREPAAYFAFNPASERVCMCTNHIKSAEIALYPISAYTFLVRDQDFSLYKARRKRVEAVETALKGLARALDLEKEAAVQSIQGEKQRMLQLVGFAYEEMQWRLTHSVAEMKAFLDMYIREVEDYAKKKDCLLSPDIVSLAEATLDTLLAFSLRNVACEVVEMVLGSAEWQAELSVSRILPTASTCDCEPQLESMLLHGYGQAGGMEKVQGLVKAAEGRRREALWEETEELYSRAAVIAAVYSPCQAAKCWVLLGNIPPNHTEAKAKHCFLQAFSLLPRLPMNPSIFPLLQAIGKLGLRSEQYGEAITALELALSLPSLPPNQHFLGLLALLTALGVAGQGYASRLETALALIPALDDQTSLLFTLTKSLIKANKCAEAAETLRKAVFLGENYLSKENFPSANALFLSFLPYIRIHSPHLLPQILYNMGKIQLKLEDFTSACDTLAELHNLTGFSNEKIAISLGKLCLKLRKRSTGIRYLQRTIQELQIHRKEPSEQLKAILQRLEMSPD